MKIDIIYKQAKEELTRYGNKFFTREQLDEIARA